MKPIFPVYSIIHGRIMIVARQLWLVVLLYSGEVLQHRDPLINSGGSLVLIFLLDPVESLLGFNKKATA